MVVVVLQLRSVAECSRFLWVRNSARAVTTSIKGSSLDGDAEVGRFGKAVGSHPGISLGSGVALRGVEAKLPLFLFEAALLVVRFLPSGRLLGLCN